MSSAVRSAKQATRPIPPEGDLAWDDTISTYSKSAPGGALERVVNNFIKHAPGRAPASCGQLYIKRARAAPQGNVEAAVASAVLLAW